MPLARVDVAVRGQKGPTIGDTPSHKGPMNGFGVRIPGRRGV